MIAKDGPKSTIFISKIPIDTTAKELWELFNGCGKVFDIILPRKRDKYNNRYGFVKTSNEEEAGKMISNAKARKGLGRVLKMSIYPSNTPIKRVSLNTGKKAKLKSNDKSTKGEGDRVNHVANVFENIEAEIDEDIENSLKRSLVGITKKSICARELVGEIQNNEFQEVKLLRLNDRKFLISSGDDCSLLGKKDCLSNWFHKIRNFKDDDFILSRTVIVEVLGLPMNAWKEENLRAFSSHIGEWVTWEYQDNRELCVFNPKIVILTKSFDVIEEKLCVLVKGKKYEIYFKEYKDLEKTALNDQEDNNRILSYKDSDNSERPGDISVLKGDDQSQYTNKEDNLSDSSNQRTSNSGNVEQLRQNEVSNNEGDLNLGSFHSNISAVPETILEEGNLVNERIVQGSRMKDFRTNINLDSDSSIIHEIGMTNNATSVDSIEDFESEDNQPLVINSHESICLDMDKLKMGGRRGRPKKMG